MGTVGTQDNRACSGVPIVIVQFPSARTRSRACQDPATRDEAERWETPAPAQVLVAQEAERLRAPMRRTGGGMRAAHSYRWSLAVARRRRLAWTLAPGLTDRRVTHGRHRPTQDGHPATDAIQAAPVQ